ncbi:ent-kaurene oxidase [Xylaria flabelliformis]|nr:ent-kaurene oxidase [Xylaria flabelliformis]
MNQLLSPVANQGLTFVSVAFLFTGVVGLAILLPSYATDELPLVGKELGNAEKRRKAFISRPQDLYTKGYRSFKNKIFRITGADADRFIIPRSLLNEVNRIPNEYISHDKIIEKLNESRYTGLANNQAHTDFLIDLVRNDLTHSLNRINSRLSLKASITVPEELGPCEDWKSTIVYEKLLRIVAIISGNIFLGPELCKSEEWVTSAITYTVDLFTAIGKLKQWKSWARPIGQYFIPELKSLQEHRHKARAWLAPVIAKRRLMMKEGKELPDDMLQWMMSKTAEYDIGDEELSLIQLNLSLAAINTTTRTVTSILYDIAVRHEIVAELRHEIKMVLAAHDGVLSIHALFEMKLLDSVMKESQRANPEFLVGFARYVDKPFKLSDGTRLPAGSIIESPHANIVQDPHLYSNPEIFDAHRFINLRNGTTTDPLDYKNKEQYQFVSVTKEFMAFGYGKHACPGRFFAANEIKLILVHILLEYDIKMPDHITERYTNLNMGIVSMPDPTKEILFKRAKT